MDETGLFFKLIPSKSICKSAIKGHKNFKGRVSIMLSCNMDGSEKLMPLIIGKANKLRCFKNMLKFENIPYTNLKEPVWAVEFIQIS